MKIISFAPPSGGAALYVPCRSPFSPSLRKNTLNGCRATFASTSFPLSVRCLGGGCNRTSVTRNASDSPPALTANVWSTNGWKCSNVSRASSVIVGSWCGSMLHRFAYPMIA